VGRHGLGGGLLLLARRFGRRRRTAYGGGDQNGRQERTLRMSDLLGKEMQGNPTLTAKKSSHHD
jgi:hypothetical protein